MLLENLNRVHTTPLGLERLQKNLGLNQPLEWCLAQIQNPKAQIIRKGKNWYIQIEGYEITINASSYTIITAHKR